MMKLTSWLIQPIKGNRSKRLFGLPAPLVRDEKIVQFRCKDILSAAKLFVTCIPSFMYTLSFEFLEVKLKEVNPVRRSAIFKWKDPLGALNLVFAPKGILSSF